MAGGGLSEASLLGDPSVPTRLTGRREGPNKLSGIPPVGYFSRQPRGLAHLTHQMALKSDSATPEILRRLAKNDIEQTPEQWEEKTLHKLGETSGVWVSYARRKIIPTVPTVTPQPPVKPSSEELMKALKSKMRQAQYRERAEKDPAFAESNSEADFPLPGDYEAWQEYERLKARYQQEARDYERQEKIALETFPNENRKVFSGLIDCISEASVQDLKRSKEGAQFFEDCDSYNFLQLALKEHQYLSPAVMSAAVARAKDDFERHRQSAADTIIEHVNEFRRRLEVFMKARGPGQPVPYADYDLRDQLLKSLYLPTWGPWIEGRYLNDNMPATFETLVDALKKAETTKILRTSSPIDPFQSTAHATGGYKDSSTTPPPTGPVKCGVCGCMFCAKNSKHTRCDKCQEEYVKQRKKTASKDKDKPGKTKGKGVKEKRAHATTGEEGSGDDSDDESQDEASDERTSFSCICATRASSLTEALVYLDNCSNINVIRDRSIALNTRREKVATKISGSIPGILTAEVSAEVGDLGRGCFNPSFSRNLISEDAAIRAGYTVTRDSSTDNSYYLRKEGRQPLVFTANGEGTFSMTLTAFRRHFSELYAVAHMTDVNRGDIVFTKKQRARAAIYHHDHSRCLGHLHHDKVIMALRKGLITNVPYTEADVRNALVIYGACPECSKTKGTKHKQVGHYPDPPKAPGEQLVGDLMYVGGVLFSIISCRLIKLRCVTKLQNKGAGEITRAVRECVNVWKGYGAKPKTLSWDQEPALVHCAHEIWAQHSLKVEHTSPDAHERTAEREVRTIKEHVYASILSLGHAVDAEMIDGIVRDTITLLNFFPNAETIDGTPRTFLDGERLNYERWSRVYAGQVAEFELPYAKQAGRGTRRELGYVIGHQGDNPVVRLLPSGKRLVVRSGHIQVIEKSQAILTLINQGIQGAKRQHFNDLLTEMQEFYDEPIPGEERRPEATMRVLRDDAPRLEEGNADAQPQVEGPTTVPTRDEPESVPATREDIGEPDVPQHRASDELRNMQPTLAPPETSTSVAPVRRSTRAGAQKTPGYYAKLNTGASVADYTACHLRATECSRLYGETETTKAGITEVVNMIKVRDAAEPTDFRKLDKRTIMEALPSFMFFKAKDLLPGEASSDPESIDDIPELLGEEDEIGEWTEVVSKKGKKKQATEQQQKDVKIRGRWVGGGHKQQRGEILAERVAPTARGTTHSLLMTIAAFEGRQLRVGDIPSAYLQAEHIPSNGRPVYIIADRHTTGLIIKAMPEYGKFIRPNGTMLLRVKKAMYGLVESAWLWYQELAKQLTGIGYKVSEHDRGLFYKKVFKNGKCIASNLASVHVDDIISAASPNEEGKRLEAEFWDFLEAKWPGLKLQLGPHYKHLSWNIYQDHRTGEIRKSQKDYLIEVIKSVGVKKEHKLPCRSDLLESDPKSPKLSESKASRFRSILQKIAYAREGRPDFDFPVCYLQSKQSSPSEQDWSDLEHLLSYIKKFPEKQVIVKPKDLQLRGHVDASFNMTIDARSYYGYLITLGHALISCKGGRIKTVVRSSTEAEISGVNEIVSELLWCRDVLEELGYEQHKIPISEDNQSCITMLQKEPRSFHSKSRHVRVKWAFFRQEFMKRTLFLRYCPTEKMVADLLTKPLGGKAHNLHSAVIFSGSEP